MNDADFMRRALACAARGRGHTRPNPPVGAVIVQDGRIVGEGWHKRAGGDHAEVAAIKNARRRGCASLADATLYVTLEPCSKPGRVGAGTVEEKIGETLFAKFLDANNPILLFFE